MSNTLKDKIRTEIEKQFVFSLSVDDATEVAYEFVQKALNDGIEIGSTFTELYREEKAKHYLLTGEISYK